MFRRVCRRLRKDVCSFRGLPSPWMYFTSLKSHCIAWFASVVYVPRKTEVGGLILFAPFASLRALAKDSIEQVLPKLVVRTSDLAGINRWIACWNVLQEWVLISHWLFLSAYPEHTKREQLSKRSRFALTSCRKYSLEQLSREGCSVVLLGSGRLRPGPSAY